MSDRTSAWNKSFETKFPAMHSTTGSAFNYMKEVWSETFP